VGDLDLAVGTTRVARDRARRRRCSCPPQASQRLKRRAR